MLGRVALRETILPRGGGPNNSAPVFVPTGSRVINSFFALHRYHSIYGEDVNTFRPERWDSIKPTVWEYMPFGGGPRGCQGQQKAFFEATYVIVMMAQRVERIESRDDREWAGEAKLTARNANGCLVALTAVDRQGS